MSTIRQPGSASGSSTPRALNPSIDTQMMRAEPILLASGPETMPPMTPPTLPIAISRPV